MNAESKKWCGGVIFLIVLLVSAALVSGWRVQRVADSLSQRTPSATIASLPSDLRLTQAQKEHIANLEKTYRSHIFDLCGKHCASRMKLAELLKAGNPDTKRVLEIQAEVSRISAETEEITLKHVFQVCETLEPGQKSTYLAKYGAQIEASCPMELMK